MHSKTLGTLQAAISKDSSVIHKFVQADRTGKEKLLINVINDAGLHISTNEIDEFISNPDQLMNGLEISDTDLAAIAGGGKGSADVNIGTNVKKAN